MKLFTSHEQPEQFAAINAAELERGDRVVINTASGSGYVYEAEGVSINDDSLESGSAIGSLYRANYDKTVTSDNIETSVIWAQITGTSKFATVKALAPLEVGKNAVFLTKDEEYPLWRITPIVSLDLIKSGDDFDQNKLIFERNSLKNRFMRRFKLQQS